MVDQALSDLVAVECGEGLAAAWCAKLLADLGADVIKVEPPEGDASRTAGPFPGDVPHSEKSGQFLYLNANKRGVVLNVRHERGRAVMLALLRRADIFVTDFAPGEVDRLGLDYATLQPTLPRLIAAYISPFGQTGPYRDFKGGDLVAWHMGGTGYGTPYQGVTDLEHEPPIRGGGHQALFVAGTTAVSGIMAAVFYRHVYNAGQMVDVSAMEAVANNLRPDFARYSYDRANLFPPRPQRTLPWIFPCKDGYISTSIGREHWWAGLKELMGNPEWANSPEFADVLGRRRNFDALQALLTQWYQQYSKEELYRMLVPKGVPCFPVNAISEVVNSPQYADRGFWVEQEHPVAGRVKQPGPFARYSETPWHLGQPAPTLGQHTEQVLKDELGYSANQVADLKRVGVL